MQFPMRSSPGRLLIAQLAGEVKNLDHGPGKDVPEAAAVARLHAITTNPVLLGDQLGTVLADHEQCGHFGRAVTLLRMAGADERAAADKLAWMRERLERENRTATPFESRSGLNYSNSADRPRPHTG